MKTTMIVEETIVLLNNAIQAAQNAAFARAELQERERIFNELCTNVQNATGYTLWRSHLDLDAFGWFWRFDGKKSIEYESAADAFSALRFDRVEWV